MAASYRRILVGVYGRGSGRCSWRLRVMSGESSGFQSPEIDRAILPVPSSCECTCTPHCDRSCARCLAEFCLRTDVPDSTMNSENLVLLFVTVFSFLLLVICPSGNIPYTVER